MLLTTQTDINEAIEKYGMPLLLQERITAATNEDATNNADAHANNANASANNTNADVINAETHADANFEANAEYFPDGTKFADYPEKHLDPTLAEDAEDGFIIFQHDEHGALQVTEGAKAEKMSERNGVKGDAFHCMKGMKKKEWKKRHCMY